MKRQLLLLGVASVLYAVVMSGCDFIGLDSSDEGGIGSIASLRYQNFSHFEEERMVDVGDTTLPTSVVSRVNLVADGDTIATQVGQGQSTGGLDFPAGRAVPVEALSIPENNVLASAELSLEADSSYALYTFGYAPDIKPVLLKQPVQPEGSEDEVPPLSGQATLRILNGASTVDGVDIYINRPAEADSLEPSVAEMDPVFSDVAYLDYTDTQSYEVSRDPESDIGDLLHVRVTLAADTTLIYDEMRTFAPESMQHMIMFDDDTRPNDDVHDIKLGNKSGNARMIDL